MLRLIVDEELELRLLEERHAAELFSLVEKHREHLRTWQPWPDRTRTVDDILAFIRTALAQFAANRGPTAGLWSNQALCGVASYHPIDWENRSAALGYWLAADHQGRGLVTRAVRALVTHAFTELGLNRVEIRCAVGNRKSRAIPLRLGFGEEGVVREAQWLNGRFVDHVIYGMLARDWPAAVIH
jgi:ribosomal-protein-serine acetyltransferase